MRTAAKAIISGAGCPGAETPRSHGGTGVHLRRYFRLRHSHCPPRWWFLCLLSALAALGLGCAQKPDPHTLVMIIESSPTNLDPRVGIDAQSERIDALLFDDLLDRDEHLNVKPAL